MVKALHATVIQWINCGFTGGLIVGDARMGKTKAINSLDNVVFDHNGDPIPVFRVSYGTRDKNTIRSVYATIVRRLIDPISNLRTADDLLNHLLIFFTDASISNINRRIVLIIDEAQELEVIQLYAFAELFNELEELKVNISIFFIANKDRFQPLAKKLLGKDSRFIRERFFNYIYEFHGIRTIDELRRCLTFYDETPISPSDPRSWLDYHSPKAVRAGFKITDITEMLWDLWNINYAERFGYDSWGMTYVNRTLSIAIRDYFPQYWSPDSVILQQIFEKSLDAAGNEPTLTTVFSDET